MTLRRVLALAWCVAVAAGAVGVPDARAVDFLSGEELKSTMSGITLDFLPRNARPVRHTYTETGTFFEAVVILEEQKINIIGGGKWWIEDDTLVCVQDNRPGWPKICRKYAIEDDILKQYTVNGVLTPDPMIVRPK